MRLEGFPLKDDCTAYTDGYRHCALCFDCQKSKIDRIKKYCIDTFGPDETTPPRWFVFDNIAFVFALESDYSLFILKFS